VRGELEGAAHGVAGAGDEDAHGAHAGPRDDEELGGRDDGDDGPDARARGVGRRLVDGDDGCGGLRNEVDDGVLGAVGDAEVLAGAARGKRAFGDRDFLWVRRSGSVSVQMRRWDLVVEEPVVETEQRY